MWRKGGSETEAEEDVNTSLKLMSAGRCSIDLLVWCLAGTVLDESGVREGVREILVCDLKWLRAGVSHMSCFLREVHSSLAHFTFLQCDGSEVMCKRWYP